MGLGYSNKHPNTPGRTWLILLVQISSLGIKDAEAIIEIPFLVVSSKSREQLNSKSLYRVLTELVWI